MYMDEIGNEIGPEGALHFSDSLRENYGLLSLDISSALVFLCNVLSL